MANFIDGGDATFEALAYANPHPGTQQFIVAQFEGPTPALTQAGQAFMTAARERMEAYMDHQAMRSSNALVRNLRSLWGEDVIGYLNDLQALQHAPPVMQRWIMAMPELRTLYHQQRVDGYSDTYVDLHPDVKGEAHYDYRRVIDGLMQETPEEDWSATMYLEELYPGDADLTLQEQQAVLDTWANVHSYLKTGMDDPTSSEGNERG